MDLLLFIPDLLFRLSEYAAVVNADRLQANDLEQSWRMLNWIFILMKNFYLNGKDINQDNDLQVKNLWQQGKWEDFISNRFGTTKDNVEKHFSKDPLLRFEYIKSKTVSTSVPQIENSIENSKLSIDVVIPSCAERRLITNDPAELARNVYSFRRFIPAHARILFYDVCGLNEDDKATNRRYEDGTNEAGEEIVKLNNRPRFSVTSEISSLHVPYNRTIIKKWQHPLIDPLKRHFKEIKFIPREVLEDIHNGEVPTNFYHVFKNYENLADIGLSLVMT